MEGNMGRKPVAMRAMMITAVLTLVAAGGCDNGGSAVETRDRSGEPPPRALTSDPVMTPETAAGPAQAAAARPPVTANRRETVDAKVDRLFQRNGAAFGARSPGDYLERMRVFVDHPPRGVETVRRPNGDTLFYEAATNTFAVAARDGTPRTMFKPDDGAAYWAEQKARAPNFGRNTGGAAAEP
jgi:pyocin large subunit-like protein